MGLLRSPIESSENRHKVTLAQEPFLMHIKLRKYLLQYILIRNEPRQSFLLLNPILKSIEQQFLIPLRDIVESFG